MQYTNPPIKEAILDIVVDKLAIAQIEDLLKMHEEVKDMFARKKAKMSVQQKVVLGKSGAQTEVSKPNVEGYLFYNESNTRIAQIRPDGMSLNILPSYTTFDEHLENLLSVWNIYRRMFNPHKVLGISVRYVNRILLPLPFNDFDEYIKNMPKLPDCLPDIITSFFIQVKTPWHNYQQDLREVTIVQTMERLENNNLPFILDIFVSHDFKGATDVDIKENFLELRKIKNDVFHSCITEKTTKLFN